MPIFLFLKKFSLSRPSLTFQEVQELERVYPRCVFQINVVPTEASCSLDRYHITVHQQVSRSFLFSPTESEEYIVYDTKYIKVTRVQFPLRNPVNNLNLFLQSLLQTSIVVDR